MSVAHRRLLVGLTVAVLAGCGAGGIGIAGLGGSGDLVDSQAVIPDEPAHAFADLVTEPGDLQPVWQRFGLSGEPPSVDLDDTVLLFIGFGESGSCPATFQGVRADGDVVTVRMGTEGGRACTDDYNPRTFVIAVDRDLVPTGGFVLDLSTTNRGIYGLAGSPQDTPPDGPPVVLDFTSEDLGVGMSTDPAAVEVGDMVEIAAENLGDASFLVSGRPATLHVWRDQRWLPAEGQEPYEAHPGISLRDRESVSPGERKAVATLDTDGLEPGWYAVDITLAPGGFGRADVRAVFEVVP
jgi:hypothetical protein